MRLDQAQSAVVNHCSCLHGSKLGVLAAEPEVVFALIGAKRVRTVHGILSAISSEAGSKRLRCLSLSIHCVSGSNALSPLADSVGGHQLHANDNVARDELTQVGEEGLVTVLSVELSSRVRAELGHLKFVDHEALRLDSVDDLAHLGVAVRLDHGEGALALGFKVAARVNITVVGYFEDASEDANLSANEEVIELNRGDLLLLKEDALVLDVVHLDALRHREVNDAVRSDNVGLLVVPFDLKSVLLLAQRRHILFLLNFNNCL